MASVTPQFAIRLPFGVDERGAIATVSAPLAVAKQQLVSLVGTQPGERVMRPDYGVGTKVLLFSPMDGTETIELQQEVITAVAKYAPDLTVEAVLPQRDTTEDSTLEVFLRFTTAFNGLRSDPTTTSVTVA